MYFVHTIWGNTTLKDFFIIIIIDIIIIMCQNELTARTLTLSLLKERERERQTDRQTETERVRHTDRQTETETETETDRGRPREHSFKNNDISKMNHKWPDRISFRSLTACVGSVCSSMVGKRSLVYTEILRTFYLD